MILDNPSQLLDRFHEVLVEQLRERREGDLEGPFTVAEIYQHFVPYSVHRDRLGIEMNGDYEDVLMRLLAGEGGYLELESDHARDRLRDELESTNPDTTLYREFAAVDVRLAGDVREADPVSMSTLAPEEVEEVEEVEEGVEVERAERAQGSVEAEGVADEAPPAGPAAPTSESADQAACLWCREELPDRPGLNFCPFCGTDVRVVPCPDCGEALEPRWLFCIACGTEVSRA